MPEIKINLGLKINCNMSSWLHSLLLWTQGGVDWKDCLLAASLWHSIRILFWGGLLVACSAEENTVSLLRHNLLSLEHWTWLELVEDVRLNCCCSYSPRVPSWSVLMLNQASRVRSTKHFHQIRPAWTIKFFYRFLFSFLIFENYLIREFWHHNHTITSITEATPSLGDWTQYPSLVFTSRSVWWSLSGQKSPHLPEDVQNLDCISLEKAMSNR